MHEEITGRMVWTVRWTCNRGQRSPRGGRMPDLPAAFLREPIATDINGMACVYDTNSRSRHVCTTKHSLGV